MTKTHLNDFISKAYHYLQKLPEHIIEDYILDDFELPVHLVWNQDYDTLKKFHSQTTNYFNQFRENPEFEKELVKLIQLRNILSKFILLHPLDKNSYGTSNFEQNPRKHLNQLPLKTLFNSTHLKKLYNLLVIERRLNKSQRKLFISLLLDANPQNEKINWNGYESDLRGFLKALIDNNVIKYNLSDINIFASKNFRCLDKNENFKEIKPDTFKAYQNKLSFLKALDIWNSKLGHLL